MVFTIGTRCQFPKIYSSVIGKLLVLTDCTGWQRFDLDWEAVTSWMFSKLCPGPGVNRIDGDTFLVVAPGELFFLSNFSWPVVDVGGVQLAVSEHVVIGVEEEAVTEFSSITSSAFVAGKILLFMRAFLDGFETFLKLTDFSSFVFLNLRSLFSFFICLWLLARLSHSFKVSLLPSSASTSTKS